LKGKGIVHRDIKLDNFLFESKNSKNIKLLDFGTSEMIQENNAVHFLCAGTPIYVAPEVILGNCDYKSDIWSAGVIFYIMLTGQPPFGGACDLDIIKNVRKQQLNMLKLKECGVSQGTIDLIFKLLQKGPDLRYNADQALDHPIIRRNYKKIMGYRPLYRHALINLANFETRFKMQEVVVTFMIDKFVEEKAKKALV